MGWYRSDPDAGIHGAIDWLLRHWMEGPTSRKQDWGQATTLRIIDAELKSRTPMAGQGWYVTDSGATMTVVTGPVEFTMGSWDTEQGHWKDETPHQRRIEQSFALASKAVTVRQWKAFLRDNPPAVPKEWDQRHSPEDDCPINGVDWYSAAKYCRWLSEQEGVAEDQMCYPQMAEIKEGMKLLPDQLKRTGYRLPTEAEWEYACRAGAATAWYHGSDAELLPRYAWYLKNSEDQMWPVGEKRPNDLGLFDMHGNAWTWVQDNYRNYEQGEGEAAGDDKKRIREDQNRVLRGGSYRNRATLARSAYRASDRPTNRDYNNGLRIARTCR